MGLYSSVSEQVPATSKRLAVDQPTRDTDRNRTLADQANPATDEMLLPSLKDGITLLDVDGSRDVPILQSIVLDHLLLNGGSVFWDAANGHARRPRSCGSRRASGCSTVFRTPSHGSTLERCPLRLDGAARTFKRNSQGHMSQS